MECIEAWDTCKKYERPILVSLPLASYGFVMVIFRERLSKIQQAILATGGSLSAIVVCCFTAPKEAEEGGLEPILPPVYKRREEDYQPGRPLARTFFIALPLLCALAIMMKLQDRLPRSQKVMLVGAGGLSSVVLYCFVVPSKKRAAVGDDFALVVGEERGERRAPGSALLGFMANILENKENFTLLWHIHELQERISSVDELEFLNRPAYLFCLLQMGKVSDYLRSKIIEDGEAIQANHGKRRNGGTYWNSVKVAWEESLEGLRGKEICFQSGAPSNQFESMQPLHRLDMAPQKMDLSIKSQDFLTLDEKEQIAQLIEESEGIEVNIFQEGRYLIARGDKISAVEGGKYTEKEGRIQAVFRLPKENQGELVPIEILGVASTFPLSDANSFLRDVARELPELNAATECSSSSDDGDPTSRRLLLSLFGFQREEGSNLFRLTLKGD